MKKWTLFVALIVCLIIGYGIGRQGTNSQPHVQSKAIVGVLDEIKKEGRVIVGIGQEAAPYGYRKNGELVGFDVEIARAVTKRLEAYTGRPLSLEFRAVTDETRIGWVQSGEVHMALCHINITRKRDANIDFTVPYGWDGKGVLYRAADGKRNLSWFSGKTVGFKRASSSEGEILDYFRSQGWTIPVLKQFDNHAAGIQALIDGQIDGFTDDSSIITNTAMLAGHRVGSDGDLLITDALYAAAQYGIGVPENNSHWRDMLNYCLQDLWQSGEFIAIYDKWFGPRSMCPLPIGNHRMEPFVKG